MGKITKSARAVLPPRPHAPGVTVTKLRHKIEKLKKRVPAKVKLPNEREIKRYEKVNEESGSRVGFAKAMAARAAAMNAPKPIAKRKAAPAPAHPIKRRKVGAREMKSLGGGL